MRKPGNPGLMATVTLRAGGFVGWAGGAGEGNETGKGTGRGRRDGA